MHGKGDSLPGLYTHHLSSFGGYGILTVDCVEAREAASEDFSLGVGEVTSLSFGTTSELAVCADPPVSSILGMEISLSLFPSIAVRESGTINHTLLKYSNSRVVT